MRLFNLAFPCSHLSNGCWKEKQTRNWGKKKKVLTDTENVAIAQEITCSYIDKFVAHR